MIHNETIDTQLNHRSIRKFKDQTLTKEQLETLYSVFGQTPTSMFMQNASLLHVTDPEEKKRIQKLCNQKYVGAEGDLFIFIVDLYRNQQIRKQLDKDSLTCTVTNKLESNLTKTTAVFTRLISFSKRWKIRCLLFKMSLMR